jgi:hypothetical protein
MASRAHNSARVRESNSFGKRMSNHIAYALVLYTLLLIGLVAPQLEGKDTSILPYFLLVVLVGLAILPCRNMEYRWKKADAFDQSALRPAFRNDCAMLWIGAFGLPTLLMAILWVLP